MQELALELLGLSLMLLVGEVLGDLTERQGYGRLTGVMLGGLIMGPFALGGLINDLFKVKLIYLGSDIMFLSELSVIFLVFASGLEHGVAPLRRAGAWGVMGATMGALAPFLLTLGARGLLGLDLNASLIVGTAVAPTSLAAVSGLIMEEGGGGRWTDMLISASAMDDVVSLILLSVALGLSQAKFVGALGMVRVVVFYSVSWAIIFFLSVKLVPIIVSRVSRRYLFEFSLVMLFGIIAVMEALGFSPIIAAFIAGVSLAEFSGSSALQEYSRSLLLVFGSIFFVVVGAEVNLTAVGLLGLLTAVALTALALLGKFIGVFPFSYAFTRRHDEATAVSLGMESRGEVGLSVALTALQAGIIDERCYGSLTVALILTTIIGVAAFSYYISARRALTYPAPAVPPASSPR